MFGPVQPTRFDLVFSAFGVPVRVLPSFWLMSALLGSTALEDRDYGPALLLIWVGVVFVSILVHEMGHALTAWLFGYRPRIVLYHFGGLAMFDPAPYHTFTAGKSILITLAGPGAGFVLFGIVVVTSFVLAMQPMTLHPLVQRALWDLSFVNLFWGLLNLLPVLPLDGGKICRDVCVSISPQRGEAWALWVAVITGALAAVGLLKLNMLFAGMMFAMLSFQSFQELQRRRW